jgi:hypothetical protein
VLVTVVAARIAYLAAAPGWTADWPARASERASITITPTANPVFQTVTDLRGFAGVFVMLLLSRG